MWGSLTTFAGDALEKAKTLSKDIETQLDQAVGKSIEALDGPSNAEASADAVASSTSSSGTKVYDDMGFEINVPEVSTEHGTQSASSDGQRILDKLADSSGCSEILQPSEPSTPTVRETGKKRSTGADEISLLDAKCKDLTAQLSEMRSSHDRKYEDLKSQLKEAEQASEVSSAQREEAEAALLSAESRVRELTQKNTYLEQSVSTSSSAAVRHAEEVDKLGSTLEQKIKTAMVAEMDASMKTMNSRHQEELKKASAKYEEKIEELKNEAIVNTKDAQQEIEKMYTDKYEEMKRVLETQVEHLLAEAKQHETEVKNLRGVHQTEISALNDKMTKNESNASSREQRTRERVKSIEEELAQAISARKDAEMNLLARNKTISELQNELSERSESASAAESKKDSKAEAKANEKPKLRNALNKISELEEGVAKLQLTLQETESALQHSKRTAEELELNNTQQKTELAESEALVSSLKADHGESVKNAEMDKKVQRDLTVQVSKLEQEAQKLRGKVDAASRKETKVKSVHEKLTATLKEEVSKLKESLIAAEKVQAASVAAAEKSDAGSKALQKSLEELSEKLKSAEGSNRELTEFKEAAESAPPSALSEEMKKVSESLSERDSQLKKVSSDLEKLRSEAKEASATAERQAKAQESEIEQLKRRNADVGEELAQKNALVREAQSSKVVGQDLTKQLAKLQDELEDRDKKLAAFQQEGASLSKKQGELEKGIRKSRGEIREKEKEVADLKESKGQLVKAIEEMQANIRKNESEASSASKSLSAMQAVSQASADKLARLEAEIVSKSEEVSSQKRALEQAWTETNELKRSVVELRAERDDLRTQLDNKSTRESETETSRRDVEQREAVLRATHQQLQDSLQRQMSEASTREERLRDELFEMRKRWQDAVGSKESLASELGSATAPLLRQIAAMQDSIRVKTDNWHSAEVSLSERAMRAEAAFSKAQVQRADMATKEQDAQQALKDATSRADELARQLTATEAQVASAASCETQLREQLAEVESRYALEMAQSESMAASLRELELKQETELLKAQDALALATKEGAIGLEETRAEVVALRRLLAEERGSGGHSGASGDVGVGEVFSLGGSGSGRSSGSALAMLGEGESRAEAQASIVSEIGDSLTSKVQSHSQGPMLEVLPSGEVSFVQRERFAMDSRRRQEDESSKSQQLSQLQASRDSLLEEVSYLSAANARLEEELSGVSTMKNGARSLRDELTTTKRQLELALEVLGEKEEQLEDTLKDMAEVKDLYQGHIQELLDKVLPPDLAGASAASAEHYDEKVDVTQESRQIGGAVAV
jgi:chromosome segregation ATPase